MMWPARYFKNWVVLVVGGCCVFGQAWADPEKGHYDAACLQELMETAPDDTTLDQLREACRIVDTPAED